MAHLEPPPQVTVGVDTHKDLHVAAARDQLGRRLGTTTAPASRAGYVELLAWARGLGEVAAWGVEGTGSYGAGLARFLTAHHQRVLEVNRPDRATRRRRGKSDPVDADAAARTVQAGEASGTPKAQDGMVEMVRALRVVRQSAVKASTQTINAIKALLVTAPAELREHLDGLPTAALVRQAIVLEPGPGKPATPTAATMLALRSLAGRYQHLDAEVRVLTRELDRLTAKHAPALRALLGVGPDSAAALLICAGDNPSRLRCEAALAALCGSSPVQASSGKTRRHRLNRGGDRQANAALHRIVIVRLRWHQPTKDYMARRTAEGKTKKEIIRCLKRYVAREVFAALRHTGQQTLPTAA
jgi:transposase